MLRRSAIKFVIVLSLAVSSLLATTVADAAKCKFQTDTVNVLTGEKIRWTKWATLKMRWEATHGVLSSAISEGDRKYLGLRLHLTKTVDYRPAKDDLDNALVIPAASKLSIAMADRSILELYTEFKIIGDSYFTLLDSGDYAITTNAVVNYSLNDYTREALAAQRVKQLRLQTADSDIDFEFGKKGSNKLQDILPCIQ